MRNFLLVDFEFTTYTRAIGRPSNFFSEIIEIGAVKLDENLKVCGTLHAFVKPKFFPKQAKDSIGFLHDYRKRHEEGLGFRANGKPAHWSVRSRGDLFRGLGQGRFQGSGYWLQETQDR